MKPQAEEAKTIHELCGFVCLWVVRHGEVDVEQVDLRYDNKHHESGGSDMRKKTNQFLMSVNNLSDTFTGESLLPESPLDVIQDFSVRWV